MERIFKEYKNYKVELEAYDINEVSQDKKKTEFYQESKAALEHVEKNLLEYYLQLSAFMEAIKDEIDQENSIKDDVLKARNNMLEVKALFPAAL